MRDPDDARVYVSERKLKKKPGYALRWIDPSTGKWRSKAAGTDRRRAVFDAANLERELQRGTHRDVRRIGWAAFTDEVVGSKAGTHAAELKRTLDEFGRLCEPGSPRVVRFAMIRTYDRLLQDRGNSVSTRNKKARYLRLAFREAFRLEYTGSNPLDGWTWAKEKKHELRILGRDEEQALLAAAESLYGFQMGAFARFVLATWGRLAEVTRLAWTDVNFGDSSVLFRQTKSHEDRYIPLDPAGGVPDDLRRLRVMTLQAGGPFIRYRDRSNLNKKWHEIVAEAGIKPICVHDLRRTGISRALLAGMAPVAVQAMAGHRDIRTTLRYYVQVNRNDLRLAVAKLAAG